jgi:amidase
VTSARVPGYCRFVTQIHDLTAAEQVSAIRRRELSPVELTDHYLERIDRLNTQVGAYVTVAAESARDQARSAEKMLNDPAGPPPLAGLPVPIKDLNMVAGVPTTLGSAAYDDLVPPIDDNVTGTVMLGKTNTPEFGLPCYTENAVAPPARTPWDLARSAGGSSGGAAAAVAAGLAPIAQGSDGGGSIRIPASVCGLFGIKPTRGRISHGPIVADLAGLSINGPIARTVRDAAMLLDVMSRNVPGDLYRAAPRGGSFLNAADESPQRLRLARSADPLIPGAVVHPDCLAAYDAATGLLVELGHEVEELPPVFNDGLVAHFEVLWTVMAALTPVPPGREDRLQPLTRHLRSRGEAVSGVRLFTAQSALQAAVRAALPVLEGYDAVLHPTLALPPVPIGYFHDQDPAENFERQKRFTPFTSIYNVSGQPAVSLPLHWTDEGVPVGVQLTAGPWQEARLISLSAQLEQARPWAQRSPALSAAA